MRFYAERLKAERIIISAVQVLSLILTQFFSQMQAYFQWWSNQYCYLKTLLSLKGNGRCKAKTFSLSKGLTHVAFMIAAILHNYQRPWQQKRHKRSSTLICEIKSRTNHYYYFCRTKSILYFHRTFFSPNLPNLLFWVKNVLRELFHPICFAASAAALPPFCHLACVTRR